MDTVKTFFVDKLSTQPILTSIRAGWDYVRAHPAGVGLAAAGLYGLWYCYRPRNMPPGPWGYPLVGSSFSLGMEEHQDMLELSKKYGDVFTLWEGGGRYAVILNSYDAAKEMFVTRGSTFANRNSFVGEGFLGVQEELFSSEYAQAKVGRKLVSTALRKSAMSSDGWNVTMATEVDELIERLLSDGQPQEIQALLFAAASKHHCRLLFGKRELLPNDPDNQKLTQIVQNSILNFILGITFQKLPNPFQCVLRYFNRRRAWANMKPIHDAILKELDEHVRTFNPDVPRDIMDIYLAAGELERVGRKEFAININLILPDGAHSISLPISWMIVYLIRYPEYQEQIYDEVKGVAHEDGRVHLEDKTNLHLTRAFIDEVLRHTTLVPTSIGQMALEDTTFRGFNLPKRTILRANLYHLDNDPHRFKDPEKFLPERYIDGDKYSSNEAIAPSTFSFGRRSCGGQQLAQAFMFYTVANLVLKLRVDLAPGESLPDINKKPWRYMRIIDSLKVVATARQ